MEPGGLCASARGPLTLPLRSAYRDHRLHMLPSFRLLEGLYPLEFTEQRTGRQMLIRRLATRRNPTDQPRVRYDEERGVSQVEEDGRWVNSWDSKLIPETKKADHETGEDQKGE